MRTEKSELEKGDGNALPHFWENAGPWDMHSLLSLLVSVNFMLLSKVWDATSLSLLGFKLYPN